MGAKSGSITYRRFSVKDFTPDMVPSNFREAFTTRIMLNAFRPIDPEGDELRTAGWVNAEQILDHDFAGQHEKFLHNEFICLALRVDTLKVPGHLFKAYLAKAKEERQAEQKRDKLTKGEEEVLKLEVQRQLRRQSMPSIRTVDMVFNIQTGAVRFWSTSAKLCDEFMGFFEDTFQVVLVPEVPYTIAARLVRDDQELYRRLQEALPAPLFF